MSHLGSFGAALKEIDPDAERDTFEFFGEHFVVEGVIPPMLMLSLGAAATGKIDDQEGLASLYTALGCLLDADPEKGENFNRFYKLAVAKRCDLEDLMKLTMALFEAQAGRPTEGRPDSSPGPSTTSPSSSGSASQHPAFAHLKPVNSLLAS